MAKELAYDYSKLGALSVLTGDIERAIEYSCKAWNMNIRLLEKRKEEEFAQSISQICKVICHTLGKLKLGAENENECNGELERFNYLYRVLDVLDTLYSEKPESGYWEWLESCKERISKIKNTGAN